MDLYKNKEFVWLIRKAVMYLAVAIALVATALSINDFTINIATGSAGVLFMALTFIKIVEIDRWPCKHYFPK